MPQMVNPIVNNISGKNYVNHLFVVPNPDTQAPFSVMYFQVYIENVCRCTVYIQVNLLFYLCNMITRISNEPRSKRQCNLSQAQYVLIHTALIEYSQFGETEISLSDFHSEVNTLRQKEGHEPSFMAMEFQVRASSFISSNGLILIFI